MLTKGQFWTRVATHRVGAALLALITTACASAPGRSHESPRPPASVAEQVAHAGTLEREGDLNHALVEYVAVAAAKPGDAEARYHVARVEQAMGNLPQARDAYLHAVKLNPNHTAALESLGLLQLEGGDQVYSDRNLKRAIALGGERWRALDGLGIIADVKGDHAAAQVYFQRALRQQPQRAEVLNNLGYSFYLGGDLGKAKSYFLQALALQPAYQDALNNLALVCVRSGDYPGAVDAFSETLKPYQAYNNVGYLLFLFGRLAPAREYLRHAITLSPTYYEVAQQNLDRVESAMQGNLGPGPVAVAQ